MRFSTLAQRYSSLAFTALALGFACSRHTAPASPAEANSAAPERESTAELPSETDPKAAPLALVSSVWSPFTDVEGKPRIATSLVQEALRRIDQPVTFATRPFSEVTGSIEAGEYSGSEALWKSSEREKYLLYSRPYLENRLVLLARKGQDVSATALGDLAGKSLGLVKGYAYGSEVEGEGRIAKSYFSTDEETLRALLRGEVDYILVDDLLAYHLFAHENEKAGELLVAGPHPLVLKGLHLTLRKDLPGAQKLLERFDAAIQEMVRAGDFHRILNVHWIEVDADEDGQTELIATGNQVGMHTPQLSYLLFGSRAQTTPRFMIDDEIYEDWSTVPDRYKVPPESIDGFRPGINAVLFEF